MEADGRADWSIVDHTELPTHARARAQVTRQPGGSPENSSENFWGSLTRPTDAPIFYCRQYRTVHARARVGMSVLPTIDKVTMQFQKLKLKFL